MLTPLANGLSNPFPLPGGQLAAWLETFCGILLLVFFISFLYLLFTSRGDS